MTGIERLRELGGAVSHGVRLYDVTSRDYDEREGLSYKNCGGFLGEIVSDIADQIEREHAKDCYKMGLNHGTVSRVIADMEHHVLGHEGMEDSTVARWARELREALGAGRDTAADVSMSAYDLLSADERDAIACVRDHGGLERVKAQRRESMPPAAYERKKAGFLGHIAECETALGRRNERISELEERVRVRERANDELNEELNAMRPRLMPPDKEWPRYKDGAPVNFDDTVTDTEGFEFKVKSFEFHPNGFTLHGEFDESHWYEDDDRFDYPAPKVLDADGVEIRAKETVFDKNTGEELIVTGFEDGRVWCEHRMTDADALPVRGMWSPGQLTHERPVLDADGVPIKVGDTVYFTDGREQECNTVVRAKYDYKDEPYVQLGRLNEVGYPTYTNCSCIDPSQLTHERPIADTWERIEEDAGCTATKYNERRGTIFTTKQQVARDLVRRAKKLAGVSE